MWDVGPLFTKRQDLRIQLTVQFVHTTCIVIYANINSWSDWTKGIHFTQFYGERQFFATDPIEQLEGFAFGAGQGTRWQNRQVSRQVRELRMQFAAKLFDELPSRIP